MLGWASFLGRDGGDDDWELLPLKLSPGSSRLSAESSQNRAARDDASELSYRALSPAFGGLYIYYYT
jgi:hypothetical protein